MGENDTPSQTGAYHVGWPVTPHCIGTLAPFGNARAAINDTRTIAVSAPIAIERIAATSASVPEKLLVAAVKVVCNPGRKGH